MAVCARGSVLVFYAVFAGGGGVNFFWGGGGEIWVGLFFRVGCR